jgi:polar amino acid transport system substrate-binding protein
MNRTKIMGYTLLLGGALLCAGSISAKELKFTTQDFAPFHYEIDGVVSGPAVEIITEVCREMKTVCTCEMLPWTRAQVYVKEGKANGMFLIGWNEERTKWLYFSSPFLKTEYGFFVQATNPLEFKQVSDIKGYTIGVYGPSNTSKSVEDIKNEIQDLTIDMTPDDEAAFKKLSVGRVKTVYSNKDVGNALIKKLKLENIRYAGAHKKLNYYIGFSQQFTDKSLVDEFNAVFQSLKERGEIQKILTKYNMDPAEADIK